MSEHEGDPELSADPELRGAFDELRESVGSGVDVDAGLQELHRSAGSGRGRGRGRIRRPAILGIAAAVVAVLAIGSVAVWQGGDSSDQVLSADGSDNGPAAPAESTCDGEALVYVNPSATAEQVSAVGQAIAGMEGVVASTYVDPAETYAEFQRLFADSPEFVDSIDPAELPSSFRVSFAPRITTEQLGRLQAVPGAYRVEVPSEYDCRLAGREPSVTTAPAGPEHSEATTTTYPVMPTAQSPATTGPPVVVDGAPDLASGTMSLVSTEVPVVCAEVDGLITLEQEALGCPPPGEQILGTVTVDGTIVLVTSATALFGCGPTDAMEPIAFDELTRRFGETEAVNALASVWFLDPWSDGSLPLVRAAQLSFGSCG